MITIKDIAKKVHVSPSTVSKALSGADDISEETRKTVVDCAQSCGYVPRKYSTPDRGRLAVLIEGIDYNSNDQFGYEIILGFQIAASQANYNVNIISVLPDQNNKSYHAIMEEGKFSAAFLLGMNLRDKRLEELKSTEYPSVLLDNYIENPRVAYVGSDNTVGMDLAIKHLFALGHRRIALFNGEAPSMVTFERRQAFKLAMRRNGLTFESELYSEGDFFEDKSKDCVPAFIKNGATAIVCASDVIAGYCMRFLREQGLRVPQDISVIGFDNIPLSRYLDMTTIAQNRIDLGKMAFTVLKELVAGVSVNRLLLRPKLVVRNTTAAAKAR